MRTRGFYLTVTLLMLTAIVLATIACRPAEPAGKPGDGPLPSLGDELTIEEASQVIGLPVPAPTYLPEGYEITAVELEAVGLPGRWDITITIESTDAGAQSPGPIVFDVIGFSMGMKILGEPGVEKVMVGDRQALVHRYPDHITLKWMGGELRLAGNEELELDELVRIAESVTSTPDRVLEVSLEPASDLLVLRGQSRRIIVHLQNNSTKYIEVSVSQDRDRTDLPEGIGVDVRDGLLTLEPRQSADVVVDIEIEDDAPSPTWPHREASVVSPTGVPPPLAGARTESPYYGLRFAVSYSYTTWKDTSVEGHDSLSTRLRIDPPSVLPPGMVTLEEAEAAADFPVATLLPQYLPEGVSPPPLGYGVSPEEPHSITAFYSAFRVVLSPEPGVMTPPESVVGERTTIRTKTVVIGRDRIDWWADDIHRAVISKEIPMSELKLVAESMMLIGVFSGSWLEAGP